MDKKEEIGLSHALLAIIIVTSILQSKRMNGARADSVDENVLRQGGFL